MLTILKIAWRSIWRNRRRTLISLSAIGIGLTLVIFYGGLLAGVFGDAKNQLDNMGMGHVEITSAGWRAHRLSSENLSEPAQVLDSLQLPQKTESGWRVLTRGLISSARSSEGVELYGVDWAREAALSIVVRDIRQGQRPDPEDDRGILIGEKLAERLKVKVGNKVRLMAQRSDGEIGAGLYRVRGIFHSMAPSISARRVFVNETSSRNLLGLGTVAHQLVIQLDRAADADRLAREWQSQLGPKFEVLSYGDLLPALRNIEKLSDQIIWIAAAFVYSLVGLGILNTLLMSVMERSREFGVLRAIGTRPSRIVAQILGESFWIGTLGGLFGLLAGSLLTWYGSTHSLMNIAGKSGEEAIEYAGTAMISDVKTVFSMAEAIKASCLIYLMSLGAALYPAWKVARLPPAQALRKV